MVAAARLAQEGQMKLGESETKWRRCTAAQRVITRRPGFDWDARIDMAAGMKASVHDAYVAGEGILHAALFGLVTVAEIRGTPEAAQGELLRFLEAAWYPTALLPSQDGATAVSLDFGFDNEGLIRGVRAAARHRIVKGALVAAPWLGRFWNYENRGGMRVPLEAKWRGSFRGVRGRTGVAASPRSPISSCGE